MLRSFAAMFTSSSSSSSSHFTEEELFYRAYASLRENLGLYEARFQEQTEDILYSDMSPEQQATFEAMIRDDDAYGVNAKLETTPENKTRILELLSEWLSGQSFIHYLSEKANKIVDAYRDPHNRTVVQGLDSAIRSDNQALIREFEIANDSTWQAIETWNPHDFPSL